MLPKSREGRRLFCGGVLLALSAVSVLAARGFHKPYVAQAPDFRHKGPSGAKITIVEFSDFECPACAASQAVLKKLDGLYGRDIRIVFKHFPLDRHPRARDAARAAECAGRQGKFWELHDIFFSRQAEWSDGPPGPDWTTPFAKAAGLDEAAFAACLQDPASAQAVEEDAREAEARWVGSTPTFFVNGRRFAGGRQLSTLGSIFIEKELKK